ncbi:MAG: hypothetical protein V3V53_12525 [Bacteroidales bacterium]
MPLQNLHHIRFAIKSLVLIFLLSVDFAATNAQDMIIGHNQAHLEDLKSVPLEWIDSAKAKLKVAYFHTSHGSQINSGLTPLDAFMGGEGIYLRSEEGGPGILYFDDHYGPGGTKITGGERTVPVQFMFMTGHLNGGGEGGSTDVINTFIRDHCIANSRILYDFADIESYDPDDNYFLDDFTDDECNYLVDGARTGNWAREWAEGRIMMAGWEGDTSNQTTGISSFTRPA